MKGERVSPEVCQLEENPVAAWINDLLLMLPVRRLLFLAGFVCLTSTLFATEAEEALLKAARDGDAARIVLALSEAGPDTRDAEGRTALMLAAQAGDFESVRRLIWGGASASLKDPKGRIARDFLNPEGEAFAPLTLILRCHAFCQEYGRPGGKARIPNLALVNDMWVDPSHPKLKPLYAVNLAEQNGRAGVDDDKNGFVDDVFGWNFPNNEPLKAPQLSLDDTPQTRQFLSQLVADFLAANEGDQKLGAILKGRYQNPLVRQIGFQNLAEAQIDLNDLAYASMLYSASHGTHVAGIIAKYSEGKAKILGTAIGSAVPPTGGTFADIEAVARLAEASPDYATFIVSLLDRYRGEAIAKGRRASDYLRACGAGVANMSWCRNRSFHEGLAKELEKIYREHGKNPTSVDAPPPEKYALLLANLPLELTIADAAAFALAFYENPDVLIVIAAGNAKENNDDLLPSPQYLSRFFPNVITIASVDDQGKPSRFTNFGTRSVQLAAPGEKIQSTILAGLEAPMTGTSMAAPVVAGVAAGIRANFPELSAKDIRRLLEASAARSADLANICTSSGVLDAKAARQMAASWSQNNLAMLVEEVRHAKAPGRDGPRLRVGKLLAKATQKIAGKAAAKGQGPFRISAVNGFGKSWRVTLAKGTPYTEQMQLGLGPWPEKEVSDGWDKGFRISSISGDQDTWNIVMSKGMPGNQSVFGYDLDQQKISAAFEEGYSITSVAGWKDRWLVVMSTETGYGLQRYTLPSPLNDSRRQWIAQRWNEGFRITAVAGDDDPGVEDDGWLFVMTKNSGLADQLFSGPSAWPAQWIAERQQEGYRITSTAGAADRTIVIMSKGTQLGEEVSSDEGDYPSAWMQEQWSN